MYIFQSTQYPVFIQIYQITLDGLPPTGFDMYVHTFITRRLNAMPQENEDQYELYLQCIFTCYMVK